MTLPILGIVGYSGSGKTTLLKRVLPLLRQRGIKPALIKHTHHDVDVDTPGKDSFELRKAGADQTIVVCDQRWALMTETPQHPVLLAALCAQLDASLLDLVLVEGFKHEPIPKIMLYRETVNKPLASLLIPTDSQLIALGTDNPTALPCALSVPVLDINQPAQFADFIQTWLKLPA
ncbi:MAG: molybdopterin-guanine dinucleotide biosynthesis protein MobB [Plesiomonas sp.]|uniref:molybdopterin-guanine dinucleotide biosynthesis protein MobB n=1 Tax=Plesiomonas sp. TaxID=2486279 RepID=UPI003F2EFB0C